MRRTVFFAIVLVVVFSLGGAAYAQEMEQIGTEDMYIGDGRLLVNGFFSDSMSEGDSIELMKYDKPVGDAVALQVKETYIVLAMRRLDTGIFLNRITGIRKKPVEKVKTITKTIGPESFMPRDYVPALDYGSAEKIERDKREGRIKIWTEDDNIGKTDDQEFLESIGRIKAEYDGVKKIGVKSTISSRRRNAVIKRKNADE